jgi:carboxylesterase
MFKDTVRLLPRITAPVRVFRSTVDHVVSDSSITALRRGLTHAQLQLTRLDNSYHVATLDHDADQIFSGSVDFIRSVVAGIRQGPADSATASQKGATDE